MPIAVPGGIFSRFSDRRRREVSRLFLEAMAPPPGTTCLELGGPIFGLEGVTERFSRYIVLNLERRWVEQSRTIDSHADAELIHADATALSFAAKSVDFILSNALIEHISPKLRPSLAAEVRRVARQGYLLAAPHYWFPFEPHYQLPLMQYLPESLKRGITHKWQVGGMNRRTYEPISLVTERELKRLFPGANVGGLSFTGTLAETLYVWQRWI